MAWEKVREKTALPSKGVGILNLRRDGSCLVGSFSVGTGRNSSNCSWDREHLSRIEFPIRVFGARSNVHL